MTLLVLNNRAQEYSYLNISCLNSAFFGGGGGVGGGGAKHSRSGWGRGVQLVK